MNFEEKIDAMRMTLELAIHDIEAQRASIDAQRASIQELRELAALDRDAIHELVGIAQSLVVTAQSHERRITGLEGRPNA
jgi:hypothetical protein